MSGEQPRDRAEQPTDRSPLETLREMNLEPGRIALWAVTFLIVAGMWLFFWSFTGTIIVGLFVYYVARPVFARIHTRIHNRTLAVAATILTVALPVLVLVAWAGAVLFGVVADLLAVENEAVAGALAPLLEALGDTEATVSAAIADPIGFLQTDLGTLLTDLLSGALASIGTAGLLGLQAFIVLVIAFYLLRDDYRIAAWSRRTFAPEGGAVETYLRAVDDDLESVFFGNILNAIVTGLIAVVTYLALNTVSPPLLAIPQPALVGMLVGAASLVPAVGIKLVTWPVGFYLLVRAVQTTPETLWFPALFFVVSFVVVDYIPDQLLRPYVSGRSLHVGAIMLAYLFGPILFGPVGIFLGPFLLVLVFEFARIVVPWLFGRELPDLPEAPAGPTTPGGREVEPAPAGTSPPEEDTASTGDDTTAGATPSSENP